MEIFGGVVSIRQNFKIIAGQIFYSERVPVKHNIVGSGTT